jgi:L-threonine-O-3-phosphate decarboxylase
MKTRHRYPEPRPELCALPLGVHGGSSGLDAADVLDFSTNINPYGPSPEVRAALAATTVSEYPDPEARLLRQALAKHIGVTQEQILPGNGASELIWLIALAFLRHGDRVVILGPTYCEYARAAILMGACIYSWQASEEDDFNVDPAAVGRLLEKQRPRLAFLCNPNNPTGAVLAPQTIVSWARQHPATLFVVDEAYLSFAPDLESVLRYPASNLLVLRSLTKDFGLAGLRLGYAVGDPECLGWLARVKPPWSVNALAQSAGVAVLGDLDYCQQSLAWLRAAKTELIEGLIAIGKTPLPSSVPFFLLPAEDGAAFRLDLLRRGILVRDCASFGLPGHVRIATRTPEQNRRLLAALDATPGATREVQHAG